MSENIKTWPERLYFYDAEYPVIERELLAECGNIEGIYPTEYIRADLAQPLDVEKLARAIENRIYALPSDAAAIIEELQRGDKNERTFYT